MNYSQIINNLDFFIFNFANLSHLLGKNIRDETIEYLIKNVTSIKIIILRVEFNTFDYEIAFKVWLVLSSKFL